MGFPFLLSYSAIRLLQADPTVCSLTDGLVARDGFLEGEGRALQGHPGRSLFGGPVGGVWGLDPVVIPPMPCPEPSSSKTQVVQYM